MKKKRRKFTAAYKAKVAIEALKEKLTLQEISSKYTINQNQITTWKKEFIDKSEMIFSREKQEKVDE
jgi:transposase-like protein